MAQPGKGFRIRDVHRVWSIACGRSGSQGAEGPPGKPEHAEFARPVTNQWQCCLVCFPQIATRWQMPEQGAASPSSRRGERSGRTSSAPCSSLLPLCEVAVSCLGSFVGMGLTAVERRPQISVLSSQLGCVSDCWAACLERWLSSVISRGRRQAPPTINNTSVLKYLAALP